MYGILFGIALQRRNEVEQRLSKVSWIMDRWNDGGSSEGRCPLLVSYYRSTVTIRRLPIWLLLLGLAHWFTIWKLGIRIEEASWPHTSKGMRSYETVCYTYETSNNYQQFITRHADTYPKTECHLPYQSGGHIKRERERKKDEKGK
jgi:hypothetical protein